MKKLCCIIPLIFILIACNKNSISKDQADIFKMNNTSTILSEEKDSYDIGYLYSNPSNIDSYELEFGQVRFDRVNESVHPFWNLYFTYVPLNKDVYIGETAIPVIQSESFKEIETSLAIIPTQIVFSDIDSFKQDIVYNIQDAGLYINTIGKLLVSGDDTYLINVTFHSNLVEAHDSSCSDSHPQYITEDILEVEGGYIYSTISHIEPDENEYQEELIKELFSIRDSLIQTLLEMDIRTDNFIFVEAH